MKKNTTNFNPGNKAFTLLEFIIIMGLISLLSAVLLVGRQSAEQKLGLRRSAFKLFQDLREAQGMAMSGQATDCGGSKTYNFGVYFDKNIFPDSYIIFADCNNNYQKDASDKTLKEEKMEKGVELFSFAPEPLTIVFSPPDPLTYINGSPQKNEAEIVLALVSDPEISGNQKKIRINTAGRVEIE